jgi:hypothetical protein
MRTPRQNRVTPFGELIATDARGTLMGNRGCLHDDQQRIRRAFAVKRWIICVLEFRGRYRNVMTPGRYTELFFLDEATALAAGHRPCAECQRDRYRLFRESWAAGNPVSADEMDSVLHEERLNGANGKRTYTARPTDLPSGVMVADDDGLAYLALENGLLQWEPRGYVRRIPKPRNVSMRVLTPRSVVQAIARGYPVTVHQSSTGT